MRIWQPHHRLQLQKTQKKYRISSSQFQLLSFESEKKLLSQNDISPFIYHPSMFFLVSSEQVEQIKGMAEGLGKIYFQASAHKEITLSFEFS